MLVARHALLLALPLSLSMLGVACSGDDGIASDSETAGTAGTSSTSTTGDSTSTTDDSTSTTAESTSSATGESETGTETTGAEATVTLSGELSLMPNGFNKVIDGEVCFVVDDVAEPCTMTNGVGRYTLEGIPANTRGAVVFADNKTVTFAWMLQTMSEDFFGSLWLDTPELVQSYYGAAGVERIDGRIVVLTELSPMQSAGYNAVLSPMSGVGPFYYKTHSGTLDLEATETTDSVAMGVFLNVDPADGPFLFGFEKEGVPCEDTFYGAPFGEVAVPAGAELIYRSYVCP